MHTVAFEFSVHLGGEADSVDTVVYCETVQWDPSPAYGDKEHTQEFIYMR